MVSGDYCDLFEIDDGLLFMLGMFPERVLRRQWS
jgi:hypothetical protein